MLSGRGDGSKRCDARKASGIDANDCAAVLSAALRRVSAAALVLALASVLQDASFHSSGFVLLCGARRASSGQSRAATDRHAKP